MFIDTTLLIFRRSLRSRRWLILHCFYNFSLKNVHSIVWMPCSPFKCVNSTWAQIRPWYNGRFGIESALWLGRKWYIEHCQCVLCYRFMTFLSAFLMKTFTLCCLNQHVYMCLSYIIHQILLQSLRLWSVTSFFDLVYLYHSHAVLCLKLFYF